MFERLKRTFSPAATFRECRRCGTTVEETPDCPACGSGDIARYEF